MYFKQTNAFYLHFTNLLFARLNNWQFKYFWLLAWGVISVIYVIDAFYLPFTCLLFARLNYWRFKYFWLLAWGVIKIIYVIDLTISSECHNVYLTKRVLIYTIGCNRRGMFWSSLNFAFASRWVLWLGTDYNFILILTLLFLKNVMEC